MLDGERISYRALDVEQIGSVCETMMGFRLETARGLSVAIKEQKKQDAPTTVDLEALLDAPAGRDLSSRPATSASSWADAFEEQRRARLQRGRVPLDYPGLVAADWPELLTIVEERVRPERMKVNRPVRRNRWWQFGDRQPALFAAIAGLERVLVVPQTSNIQALVFLLPEMVFGHTLIVFFPLTMYGSFAVLQSRSSPYTPNWRR